MLWGNIKKEVKRTESAMESRCNFKEWKVGVILTWKASLGKLYISEHMKKDREDVVMDVGGDHSRQCPQLM